jgi:polysaccharide biosynthesis transport protein
MSIVVKRASNSNDDNWQESPPEQRSQSKALSSGLTAANSDEGGLDLDRVWRAIRRRLWIIAIANIVTIVAVVALGRTKQASYEGKFNILIEPVTAEGQVVSSLNKVNQTSVEEQDLGSAQALKTTLDYPTQIQILLSDKILLPVVKQLQVEYPNISYETLRNSLKINRLKDQSETKILEVHYQSASNSETKRVMDLLSTAYIQYSLSERKTNVRRALQFVDTQLPNARTQVSDLELALQKFREQNNLVDPTILGTQLGTQMSATKQERSTTQVELAKAKQLYLSLQQQIQLQPQAAEAASVLSEAPGYQQLVKQLQDIDVELKTLSAQLTEEHPRIILLREKRKNLEPLLKQNASEILGSSLSQAIPDAQALPYQNALRQDLSKQLIAADTQVKVLEAKLKGLNLVNESLAGESNRLPIISRQYENIQRQLKIATEQLSKFLQKREELTINAARQEVPWELVAMPAVKEIPSGSLTSNLVLGSIAGLIFGTGLALVLDKMNNVIYSLKDLRDALDIPILGLIPEREDDRQSSIKSKITKRKNGVSSLQRKDISNTTAYQFSPFIESFRALNSQVRLLSPDEPVRSLVVSSSLPDEGKTTIAIQLAQAAAAMGQRVLLVNADLRKPNLQSLVNPHDRHEVIYGLTDIIAGNSQLMDTVQLLPGEDNLYILLSGSISLDPTSILSSQKMKDLMKNCERNFDLVIYDTVPLNFADSLLLIPQTDGLLMVTSLGKVDREVLRNSLRTLEVSKVSVLGLVVNMVPDRQSSVGAYYDRKVANAQAVDSLH